MILFDLLEQADENKPFIVLDYYGQEIACYDGKNSIPEELNNEEVSQVTFCEHETIVSLF